MTMQKKCNRNKSQKVFWRKTSTCRDGSLKTNQTRWKMTPPHLHTIPTSCAIVE